MSAEALAVEDVSGLPVLGAEALGVDAAGRPVLLASRCGKCNGLTFPRSQVCGVCGSLDLADEAQPRQGTLYTHTRVHVAAKRWGGPVRFGYVDLPTGLRVFAHLEGDDLDVGAPVTLDLAPRGVEGQRVTAFVFRREAR